MADELIPGDDFATWTAERWSQLVPGADATAAEVAIRFIRTAHELSQSHARAIRPWKRLGINTIDDFRILGLLRHVGESGIRMQYIAEHLATEPSTVSSRIARLEQHGLVDRVEDPSDRRANRVRLVAGQEAVVDDIYLSLVANHERFFARLSTDEHATLAEFLSKM